MRCPKCGSKKIKVIDSRSQDKSNAIKRRRECLECHHRFTTFERCEDPLEVIKSNGKIQLFDRNKLMVGLVRATVKRNVSIEELNLLIDDIISTIVDQGLSPISTEDLGEMVLERLSNLDKVAYIRFASVYRDFKNVQEFMNELKNLEEKR